MAKFRKTLFFSIVLKMNVLPSQMAQVLKKPKWKKKNKNPTFTCDYSLIYVFLKNI